MLPIYVSYFAGDGERDTRRVIKNALGFILGFTVVFVTLGALAGTVGQLLKQYSVIVNIVTGLIVIFFGLNFLGVFKLNIFKGAKFSGAKKLGFFSSLLFGVVFSIGWTPCVGAFLGSALMIAANQGHVVEGMLMLLVYSLGLGIPFFISALLIDRLKGAFSFIKKHYNVINIVSGVLLVVVGLLMATGLFSKLLSMLA
jgi:cytochrome c-type biogenesis protein